MYFWFMKRMTFILLFLIVFSCDIFSQDNCINLKFANRKWSQLPTSITTNINIEYQAPFIIHNDIILISHKIVSIKEIKVYNLLGQTIFVNNNHLINSNKIEFNSFGINRNGIYFVNITYEDINRVLRNYTLKIIISNL